MIWAAIVLSVVIKVVATQECANGHWEDCGTACPHTCESRTHPNELCPAVCVAGCVCDTGYVLHNGECIHKNDCPACPANSHWSECGSMCPQICGEIQGVCAALCVPACVCDDGYVQHYGACINPERCPGGI
ncbi:PREDICTED: cysteine-rich venom protein 6-like [Branchiostoma belcheri]|uniref:Cysteine-rich venom protein 6-like n=1 Tax=Branchiostoma belcheri TaxID=7741 RepID=A0A6P5ADC4_BRABE|nr:PREDICTED: cysteine-rich venom protein 6-like [Branchiostoma belcheri]